jgi:hypothetical protein
VIRRFLICDRNQVIKGVELEIFIWGRHIFKMGETINHMEFLAGKCVNR